MAGGYYTATPGYSWEANRMIRHLGYNIHRYVYIPYIRQDENRKHGGKMKTPLSCFSEESTCHSIIQYLYQILLFFFHFNILRIS